MEGEGWDDKQIVSTIAEAVYFPQTALSYYQYARVDRNPIDYCIVGSLEASQTKDREIRNSSPKVPRAGQMNSYGMGEKEYQSKDRADILNATLLSDIHKCSHIKYGLFFGRTDY